MVFYQRKKKLHPQSIFRMKKSLLPFSIKQKKKNFLTLYIRFGVLIAIALFYIISATLIDSNVKQNSQGKISNYF